MNMAEDDSKRGTTLQPILVPAKQVGHPIKTDKWIYIHVFVCN